MFVAQIVLIGLVVFERKSERFSFSSRSSLKNDSLIELQVKEFLFLVCVCVGLIRELEVVCAFSTGAQCESRVLVYVESVFPIL